LWAIYGFMWLGGIVSGGVSPRAPWAAPLFLVIAGVLTLLEHASAWRSLALAAMIGIAFELLGVHTGLPFGRYAYTETLGPAFHGVPLAIGFAWLILIDFARGITNSVWGGALLMTAIDLVIDPLASGPLHYWLWFRSGPYYGVPWLNFLGWALASRVILAILPASSRRMAWTGWTVVAFFTVMSLEFRLWLPGLIGLTILALTAWLRARTAQV